MNIVFLDGYTLNPGDLSWQPLEQLGSLTVYDRTPPELMVERAKDAEVVLVNKAVLNETILSQLPRLKYVGVTATGFNNIDMTAAKKHNVVVTNVKNYGAASVAQHTFALLLALVNRIETHSESVRSGNWARSKDWCYWETPLTELAGLTLGLVGLGDIGSEVARIGRALGMRTIAYRKNTTQPEEGITYVSLDELFTQSDVVSLHCPLTPETAGIINTKHITLMKSGAFVINTGRGGLVNESELAAALNEGRLAGAAVDVLSTEPPAPENPLLTARNCVITPHIAWATLESRRRLLDMAAGNIQAFIAGSPTNVVS